MTGSAFRNNSTENYGGAVYGSSNGAAVTVSGSVFESNTAKYGGAFASVGGGSVTFNGNTSFTGNTAEDGGAICVENTASLTLNTTTFDRNIANSDGGAVYAKYDDNGSEAITVTDSAFTGNRATGNRGGAIYVQDGAVLEITRGTFDGNSAEQGGAVYFSSDRINHITVGGSTFTGNRAARSMPPILA